MSPALVVVCGQIDCDAVCPKLNTALVNARRAIAKGKVHVVPATAQKNINNRDENDEGRGGGERDIERQRETERHNNKKEWDIVEIVIYLFHCSHMYLACW